MINLLLNMKLTRDFSRKREISTSNVAVTATNSRINFHSLPYDFIMKNTFKKIVFIAFLLTFAFKAFAPASESLMVLKTSPFEPYKSLIHAIGMVETQFDTLAYNPLEGAVGYFQIRPIRLEDYNNRTGNVYSMNDLFNYKISEKIFLYYATEIGPYNFERIAKTWNGSGKSTVLYWDQVRKFL
jgi:hypothetical protein